jgi:hypothetical protein
VADTNREDAARELDGSPALRAATIDAAFGPNWDKWQEHVIAHTQLPDEDGDGEAEPQEPVIPLLAYGDGPNDYIATDVDAGQVMVRDGNDKTGKAWKFPLDAFLRFVAHAQGKKLAGEPDEEKGDGPYEAARKLAGRTAKLVQSDRDAEATRDEDGNAPKRGTARTGK